MDWKILATVFAAVFVAEMADKTQLVTMLFATDKAVSKWLVFFGSASALVLTSAIGVLAGTLLSQVINVKTMSIVAGAGFILIGHVDAVPWAVQRALIGQQVADTLNRDVNHHHHHAPPDYNRAFAAGVVLNVGFVIVEAVFGVLSNSLALLTDAGHNLSDVLGLLLAWGAAALAKKRPSARRTYGFSRATIIASLFSGLLLMGAVGAIGWEAISRLMSPAQPAGKTIMIVAAIGVVINTVTALFFFSGKDHDLNIRGAFLHMAADAGGIAGRGGLGGADLLPGLQLDRPTDQPGHRRGHPALHLGPAARFAEPGGGRRAAQCRPGSRTRLPVDAVGCAGDSRPAHLADEHHRHRADRPHGDGRVSGQRQLPERGGEGSAGALFHQPPDHPAGAARRRVRLPPVGPLRRLGPVNTPRCSADSSAQAFVYLIAAVVAVPLAKRMGLGSALGYILAGVAIGPFVLGLVGQETQDVMHFAEFGVVLMLFLIGLELEPGVLWRMRVPILGLGGAQVAADGAGAGRRGAGPGPALADRRWPSA